MTVQLECSECIKQKIRDEENTKIVNVLCEKLHEYVTKVQQIKEVVN